MIVVDASALVEWVLRTPAGLAVGRSLSKGYGRTHAPSFVAVEVSQALRRLEARGLLDPPRAQRSFEAVSALRLTRHGPTSFVPRAWALRHTLSSYDAVYVALAEALGAPLLTCDARLARGHGHTAEISLAT